MDVLFLLLFSFGNKKNHTHRTVKLIVVRAFQCHMFLCVNGLVETLSPHTQLRLVEFYILGELWLSNFSLN